jgi:hypothetical protein
MLATERQEPLILEGIPVHPLERRTGVAVRNDKDVVSFTLLFVILI